MKVVYSLLAAFVVGGIVLPMTWADYPNSAASRYPTLNRPTIDERTPLNVAQAPAPKSVSSGTLPTGVTAPTSTPVPTTNTTNVNTAKIVSEPRYPNVAPRGAEPVPVNEPVAGFPIAIAPTQHVPLSLGALQPTPEMWFYEQMRQDYNNPQLQVRRNSEQAAAERKARLAASAWYGVDNSRPMAYTTPHMYHYSPSWTAGGRNPYSWSGKSSTVIIDARRVPTMGVSGIGTW